MDQPPFGAHDDAPFTLPAKTAAKIAAYEAGGAGTEEFQRLGSRGRVLGMVLAFLVGLIIVLMVLKPTI